MVYHFPVVFPGLCRRHRKTPANPRSPPSLSLTIFGFEQTGFLGPTGPTRPGKRLEKTMEHQGFMGIYRGFMGIYREFMGIYGDL